MVLRITFAYIFLVWIHLNTVLTKQCTGTNLPIWVTRKKSPTVSYLPSAQERKGLCTMAPFSLSGAFVIVMSFAREDVGNHEQKILYVEFHVELNTVEKGCNLKYAYIFHSRFVFFLGGLFIVVTKRNEDFGHNLFFGFTTCANGTVLLSLCCPSVRPSVCIEP